VPHVLQSGRSGTRFSFRARWHCRANPTAVPSANHGQDATSPSQGTGEGQSRQNQLARKIDKQTKLSGKVSEISDTGFVVTDQKTGKITKLDYQDVREARQKGMSKGLK
jgi:hypothetical protein